ncbi:A-type flagellin [mine drainage metagenome]|uniref:A-type flagellin n=1 Tax=mine drainage metagenome TaxID=410659 RepID=A0A1J5QXX5_9ZZZZ
MGLSVQTNLAALNAANNLTNTQNQLTSSLEKLSSGFRINTAADDAAGLAISEGMRSQMGGITVGIRNAQDGISVVQTAEGALNETTSILQRMRDLSVQGANSGALTADASNNIQTEINKLKTTLDSIATSTQFNGKTLLSGGYKSDFQVGANVGQTVNVTIGTNASSAGLGVDTLDVTQAVGAGASSNALTVASYSGSTGVAGVDTITNTTTGTGTTDFTTVAAFQQANGTVTLNGKSLNLRTVDFSGATGVGGTTPAANDALKILQGALDKTFGTGAVTATSSNASLTLTAATPTSAADVAAKTIGFTQWSGAESGISAIDNAINQVSTERANLGATQNQFDHIINNQNVALQNVTASESRIRDTDMAATMVDFTKSQILSQAGTAMLAQAKSLPQDVLKLLQ